jgi:DNA-binding CsgD family transcriptional regulator
VIGRLNLLVGRERELARIDAVIAQTRSGSGVAAIIEGPAGIGKTALLNVAAHRSALAGMTVFRATAGLLEQDFSFGVVRGLFTAVVSERSSLLDGAAALSAIPLGVSAGGDTSEAWGDPAAAAMHGLYWLTAKLTEDGPIALMIDDAHWADEMSLRFMLYLVRRLVDLPVLMLLAMRGDEQPDSHHELLAELSGTPELEVIRPAPLDEDAVAEIVRARGLAQADHDFIAACLEASGGNPFLLSELLTELHAKGVRGTAGDARRVGSSAPQRVVRWISARLASLGDDADRLASALAVLGPGATPAECAELAGVTPRRVGDVTDALIRANILADQRSLAFVHPLVAAAVYQRLTSRRRAEAHARAAQLTAERGAPLVRVAAHLLPAAPGDSEWTVQTLRGAACEARASGAPASATRYLERALLETMPQAARSAVLLELGEIQLQAGLAGAAHRMREALELNADPRARAEICLALGRALFTTGQYDAARETFRSGLAELSNDDDDLFLELRAWYVTDAQHDLPLSAAAATRLQALIDGEAPGATAVERRLLAQAAYEAGRSGALVCGRVASLARRALAGGELLQDSGADIGPYGAACHALVTSGQPGAAIDELTAAIEFSQRHGWWVAFAWFSHLRGVACYSRGDLVDASADLESANEAYANAGAEPLPDTRAILALCRLERDDLTGASDALACEREPSPESSCSYAYAVGRLRATQGRLREGLDALLSCDEWVRGTNAPNPAANLPWRADAALIAAQLGDSERASALIAENLRLARAFGGPGALGIALRASGLIVGGNAGREQLVQAARLLEQSGMRFQLARTLVEQGAALRRAGHRPDALQPLRRGLDLAARCGALALVRRAHDELVAAGARPRRQRIWGAEALTASELRVARMAAAGMTNAQIAQALFISRKTVTVHLTRIYQKLDITSREHLAQALGDAQSGAATVLLTSRAP